jgi:hypothetical protein
VARNLTTFSRFMGLCPPLRGSGARLHSSGSSARATEISSCQHFPSAYKRITLVPLARNLPVVCLSPANRERCGAQVKPGIPLDLFQPCPDMKPPCL